uniref:Uncharacterized protein n=1 Tax=Parascaris equorum TaxID=6256 RepID=A0A914S389_PAREQ
MLQEQEVSRSNFNEGSGGATQIVASAKGNAVPELTASVSDADPEVESSTRDLSNISLLEKSGNVPMMEPMPLSRSTPIRRKRMVPCKKNPLVDDTKLQPVMEPGGYEERQAGPVNYEKIAISGGNGALKDTSKQLEGSRWLRIGEREDIIKQKSVPESQGATNKGSPVSFEEGGQLRKKREERWSKEKEKSESWKRKNDEEMMRMRGENGKGGNEEHERQLPQQQGTGEGRLEKGGGVTEVRKESHDEGDKRLKRDRNKQKQNMERSERSEERRKREIEREEDGEESKKRNEERTERDRASQSPFDEVAGEDGKERLILGDKGRRYGREGASEEWVPLGKEAEERGRTGETKESLQERKLREGSELRKDNQGSARARLGKGRQIGEGEGPERRQLEEEKKNEDEKRGEEEKLRMAAVGSCKTGEEGHVRKERDGLTKIEGGKKRLTGEDGQGQVEKRQEREEKEHLDVEKEDEEGNVDAVHSEGLYSEEAEAPPLTPWGEESQLIKDTPQTSFTRASSVSLSSEASQQISYDATRALKQSSENAEEEKELFQRRLGEEKVMKERRKEFTMKRKKYKNPQSDDGIDKKERRSNEGKQSKLWKEKVPKEKDDT